MTLGGLTQGSRSGTLVDRFHHQGSGCEVETGRIVIAALMGEIGRLP